MRVISLVALALLTAAARGGPLQSEASLTLEGAQQVSAAAISFARANQAPGAAIAVVDAAGNLVVLQRLDGSFPAASEIAIGKARTAVRFARPSKQLEDAINGGRDAMIPLSAVTAFTPLMGGIPVVVDGQIVGAVGVSGAANAAQDEQIAAAGAASFSHGAPQATVQHFDAAALKLAFATGDTGGTLQSNAAFRVNASRRDHAGEAELHQRDTDIFYVLQGHATVVTGGELQEARNIAPGELRGSALRGGTTVSLAPGDVLTIPHGVTHWFRSVDAPFRYLVIKSVTAP